ncbi:TonB-linked SusC/RagA family outer membrane protein [Dysgonomonas hofstadii]|uniref:TonB-linked SusC/RagA family outer membrane protein n=1 Tax=Dysgonomonas hofstadii TaxID=637886 RepID=A0A840CU84_9BACT|nr:SusC/RagA family TonB-linked outer membrane protein [Dysgonomonas hofstadii]MBB4037254.1 TonB-linked SusC/RagA family outer membrane protein [Dysgonomonas hofstadii]
MKRRTHILLLCFLLSGWYGHKIHAYSYGIKTEQQTPWEIKGTITDNQNEPLIGASVVIKGTNTGTITDVDGKFSIKVSKNSVLVIKFLGFVDQEILITEPKQLSIVLEEKENVLKEVAVTALGIKREKKALGYSVGEVKGDELDKAKETNVINALAGKVPGLVISQTAGGPSGSSRVIIRGSTELTGNNQPLYVVDGVPLDNTNFGSADKNGGFDLGDGISSINPDDIENISVLKGPAASALYGSRASHGVILITTKKAAKGKAIGIEFNSTTTIEQQLTKYDNLQTTYGQGTAGRISGTDDNHSSSKSWGPKIDEGLHINYFDGVRRPYKFIENNIDGFFRTGVTTTNTVVLNANREDTGVRLSYTNMTNSDIVPNSGMGRNSINLRANTTFLKKLDLDVKMNYVREDVKNRPALSDDRTNVGKNLITLATTFDQKWLKNSYVTEDGKYYDWNNLDPYNLNPYWITNEMKNESDKDRFSGTGVLNYRITDKLSARLTAGGEVNLMKFKDFAPPTTPGKETGYLQERLFRNYTYNTELLVSYNDRVEDFSLGGNLGGNIFYVKNNTNTTTAKDMRMREVVALQSFLIKEVTEDIYQKQINSLFATANVGYKDFLYLDATLRADKSSTLPSGKNTYVYPSVSTSFLFTEAFKMNKSFLSYGKIRASAAQVGSDTDPYRLDLMYAMIDKSYLSYALGTIYNSEVPNSELKPTRTNSIETGLELRFLQNRIGLDFTYYNQRSTDQIMRLNTSITSGYNAKVVNAGEIENSGIEIVLNTRPIETKDWTWDLNFNFSKNNNKVKSLASGIERFTLAEAAWLNVTVDAVVGENYGAIMGKDFKRNDAGQIIVNGNTGLPEVADDVSVLGNATWDWTGGISTNVSYKNFSLGAIFDIKWGADMFSMTDRSYHASGKAKATLTGRDEWYTSEEKRLEANVTEAAWNATGGYLVDGVVEHVDGSGNKSYTANTKFIDPEKYWSHVATSVPSVFVHDNSYIKVRELTFSYRLPKSFVNKFAESMSVSFVARNPFIIYKNIDNIDPDSNYNNSSGMGLEFGSLPSRRSYGVNINLKF